jgi:hypothetical protein
MPSSTGFLIVGSRAPDVRAQRMASLVYKMVATPQRVPALTHPDMNGAADLPVELVLLVFLHASIDALRSLRAVNHTFHRILTPLVFCTVDVGCASSPASTRLSPLFGDCSRLVQHINTLRVLYGSVSRSMCSSPCS